MSLRNDQFMNDTLTAISGLRVGHYTNLEAGTGCTVILCPADGAIAGVDVRGPAPGTRETDLLRPGHLVERIHAILLTGGSAFGLAAASGVMQYLEEQGVGFDTGVARVPIVPAAVVFDLAVGKASVRPGADDGYRASRDASDEPVRQGNVGAGTGATVGKLRGRAGAMKGGTGSYAVRLPGDVIVGALVTVNALGDVLDPHSGKIIAGTRAENGGWLDSSLAIQGHLTPNTFREMENTTIGVVATNARLTKEQANLVAMMAHDGIARAISPAHTLFDGDALFVLSVGDAAAEINAIGQAAAEVVAESIVRAVKNAARLFDIPAWRDVNG